MSFDIAPHPLLSPLAALYGAGVSLRNTLYDRGILSAYAPHLPVVCVGNATAGGSGKSPFAQYVARLLRETGYQPALLTRGYGGAEPGPHLVSPTDPAARVGDEAVMHRALLPEEISVVVSRRRAAGVRFIDEQKIGDAVVLDDGLQHRALKRHMNILLLDASGEDGIRRWREGRLLPAGWLREPLDTALGRSDCVVFVSRGADAPASLPDLGGSLPQFLFRLAPSDFLLYGRNETASLSALAGKPVTAFSSIADPGQFFALLERLGLAVEHRRSFRDHHLFTREELKTLESQGRPLVCSEKDAVKLRAFEKLSQPCYVLRLKGEFSTPGGREGFAALLTQRMTTSGTAKG